MLAGNLAECGDDVYSYADLAVLQQTAKTPTSKSKQSATSVTAQQPHRDSQTRRAVRHREGSVCNTEDQQYYSTPYATMGNAESDMGGGNPVTYHSGAYLPVSGVTDQVITGNNCNDCGDQSISVTSVRRVTQTEQVHLGDYSVPPDHRKESIEGIRSPNPSEYCDPYEAEKLAKSRHHVKLGTRKSLPSILNKDQSDVYELASAIPDQKKTCQRTFSDSGTYDHIGTGVTLTKTPTDPDEYDHLSTWTGNNSPAKNSQDMAAAVSDVGSEPVYGGAYEEPWDTKKRQQNFSQITDKAENLFKESSAQSNDNIITGVVLRKKAEVPDTSLYEEAWDLPEKQKLFELQVQDAQKRSESAKNSSSNNQSDVQTKSSPTHPTSPGKSVHVGGDDTYESPWDKEGLEQKIQKASLQSQHSPSSQDSPPDFFAPEVPDTSEYQPAWDASPSSDFISRSTGRRTSAGRASSQRVMSRELAEKIDPTLPLDIQKFYHGGISRKQAEDLMMIHKDGSYLVRRSETQKNVFSLSMKGIRGMPMHIRIGLKNGEYILGENSQPFPTVPEVIDYYTRHELPVQGAGRLKLLYPIMRDNL